MLKLFVSCCLKELSVGKTSMILCCLSGRSNLSSRRTHAGDIRVIKSIFCSGLIDQSIIICMSEQKQKTVTKVYPFFFHKSKKEKENYRTRSLITSSLCIYDKKNSSDEKKEH